MYEVGHAQYDRKNSKMRTSSCAVALLRVRRSLFAIRLAAHYVITVHRREKLDFFPCNLDNSFDDNELIDNSLYCSICSTHLISTKRNRLVK